MNILSNEPLGWKPFGLDLTLGEWDTLVNWYVQKHFPHRYLLNTKEES
jgi:hypothetical protein